MRLRFIGTNGSMGFHFGQIYRLTVEPFNDGVQITSPVHCPYSTEEAFWRNWVRPDVELRTLMEGRGRELRQAHVAEVVPLQECARPEIHGSHNWQTLSTNEPYAWCPGRTQDAGATQERIRWPKRSHPTL